MRATAGRVAVLLAASGLAIAATPRTMTEAALREHVERHDLTHDRRDMSLDAATAWDDDDDDLGVGGGFGTRDGTRDRTARLDDVDDDPKPLDARACAPPRASDLERLGWKWNAWKYAPRFVPAEAVAYSVGVGRDITFDAALLAAHPTLEMHAFDNTPVASEFVHALGLAGGVPRAWTWHRLLLAPRDARSVALALPEGRADSYAPVADAGEGASSPVTLPARPFWRIVARLGHRLVHLLKMDVEGAEFETIAAMEAYYGEAGPPVCQFLVEWHERFFPDGGSEDPNPKPSATVGKDEPSFGVGGDGRRLSGRQLRANAESSLRRMGFREVECWSGDECAYWSCERCPKENDEKIRGRAGAIANEDRRGL